MSRVRWFLVVAVSGVVTACHVHRPPAAAPVTVQVVNPPTFQPSAAVPATRAVRVLDTADRSNRLAPAARARITGVIRRRIERTARASATAPAVVVAPSVTSITRERDAITCELTIRIAPAAGASGEVWTAERTAIATGTATATGGGNRPDQIARSIEDCVTAAAEHAVDRRVVPFLDGMLAAR